MNGIWDKYTDTNDVNASDAAFQHNVVVTGDDFGLVKLFKFPTVRKGENIALVGKCFYGACIHPLFFHSFSFIFHFISFSHDAGNDKDIEDDHVL